MDIPALKGERCYSQYQQWYGITPEVSPSWDSVFVGCWQPASDSIVLVSFSDMFLLRYQALRLSAFAESSIIGHNHSCIAAVARIADAVTQEVYLAPFEFSITPLTYQIRTMLCTITDDCRYVTDRHKLEVMRAGFKKAWHERNYSTIIAEARRIRENVLQENPELVMWYAQMLTRAKEE